MNKCVNTNHTLPTLRRYSDFAPTRKICTFADGGEGPRCANLNQITMATGQSITSKFSGKVGSVVYAVSCGVQIAREYNPIVRNPNTTPQVNQRARLKLASQLAAALSPVIAIQRQGLKSPRNLFIKKNMEQIIGNGGQAQIAYENIQLTEGNAGLPGISVARSQEHGVVVELAEAADAAVSRVVYVLYKKTSEEKLQYIGSTIQSTPGQDNNYQASFSYVSGDIIVWAYGMKDMNAAASARYGDYMCANGEDIAQLIMNRSLSTNDYQFTETRGTTLFNGETENVVVDSEHTLVFIGASGPGTVSGTGFSNGRKLVAFGESVTVAATPNSGSVFDGWFLRGTETQVSSSAEYTFTANNQTDLVAMFHTPNGEAGDAE